MLTLDTLPRRWTTAVVTRDGFVHECRQCFATIEPGELAVTAHYANGVVDAPWCERCGELAQLVRATVLKDGGGRIAYVVRYLEQAADRYEETVRANQWLAMGAPCRNFYPDSLRRYDDPDESGRQS